jgi:NosR/NirI family transcriptional regulator, nitrous oxide reductase regulator
MMKKISKLQIGRMLVQLVFLVLLPGLFTITFSEIKQVYTAIISRSFNFASAWPSLIEVLILIPLTIIVGRFFCGWICAFGTFNDILYMISKRVFNTKYRVSEKIDSALKYLKYVILVFIVAVIWTSGSTIFNSSSPWDAFAQLTDFKEAISTYAIGFTLLVLITAGSMLIERFFCRYLCPLGAIFAITSKIRIFHIDKPKDKCGACRICTNNCPMGIQLYKDDKVKSSECINCMKCVSVCPRKNTQATIAGEHINPAMGSAAAIAAFAGMYGALIMVAPVTDSKLASADTVKNSIAQAAPQETYKDGTYTGTGRGYRPGLQVEVTIEDSKITDIEIGSNNETPRYTTRPFNTIPQEIIESQSTDVDTVSGATRTSNGIIAAVEDALNQASGNTSTESNSGSTKDSGSGSSNGQDRNIPNFEGGEGRGGASGKSSGGGNRSKGPRGGSSRF